MIQHEQGKRVLLVSANEHLVGPALRILGSAGHNVAVTKDPPEARSWLRTHQANLVAVELGDDNGSARSEATNLLAEVRSGRQRGVPADVLALTRWRNQAQTRELFQNGMLTNYLGVNEDGTLDPLDLGATVAKILSRDIFGLDKYLAAGASIRTFAVRKSDDRDAIVDEAEALACASGCHGEIARGAATAAEELLTNALYDAPTDVAGKPRYAHFERAIPVELGSGEAIEFQLAFDGQRIGMSAKDPFGSLTPERVVDILSRCFLRTSYEIPEDGGGAGLGLYFIFNLVQHFVINIAPGRMTEAIGLFQVSSSMRRFKTKTKSFNVFLARS
jgi:hypothetical protein